MADTITLTFTKNSPTFILNPVLPEDLPISMAEAIQGEKGDPATSFVWTQSTALATWTIPHNLNKYPSVSVVDTLGNLVYPDVSYIDENIIQIKHGSPFAGSAYLN
jgi:hypothetical protein